MKLRTFIPWLSILVLACQAAPQAEEAAPPNILFIFSDDHATQAISAYGSRINQTPNIDRIGEEGAIFVHSFNGNSICAPSRATVLTGKHSHANGKRTNLDTFDGSQQTFPKLLQRAGYTTALIGKWHLKSAPTGFDYYDILRGQGAYYNPDFVSAEGERRIEGYNTDIVTDLALDWLKSQEGTHQPFLLMCQYKAPHRVWAPSLDHLELYADEAIPEPATLFDDYEGRSEFVKDNEMMIARHLMDEYDLKLAGSQGEDALGRKFPNPEFKRMTPEQRAAWDAAYEPRNQAFYEANLTGDELTRWKYQRYIKDYLRCVASVDDNIGRLLDYLEQAGLADNTLVIYSSDQGFYLGEHGWYDKRWMYEESFQSPLLMRWPREIPAGTRVNALVQNIDYAPSMLAAAGISPPADMHGKSVLPLLSGQSAPDWRESLYYHYYEEGEHNVPAHEGVRTDRFKLIHFYHHDTWEFYDLQERPLEMINRYEDPDYQEEVFRLKQELTKLREVYQVPDSLGSGL